MKECLIFQTYEKRQHPLHRYQKQIKGTKGENGRGKNQHGKNSSDVIVKVPQGTVVTDLDTGLIIEFANFLESL